MVADIADLYVLIQLVDFPLAYSSERYFMRFSTGGSKGLTRRWSHQVSLLGIMAGNESSLFC